MNKAEFDKRMVTANKMGLLETEVFTVLNRWADMMMRFEGGHISYFVDALVQEQSRTQGFGNGETLASDRVGYRAIQLMAILTIKCQQCAEDPNFKHTTPAYCPHEKQTRLKL